MRRVTPFLACSLIFEYTVLFHAEGNGEEGANSIVTLSLPKWAEARYAILNFICPKDGLGFLLHRRPSVFYAILEVSNSRALRFIFVSLWFTSDYPGSRLGLCS